MKKKNEKGQNTEKTPWDKFLYALVALHRIFQWCIVIVGHLICNLCMHRKINIEEKWNIKEIFTLHIIIHLLENNIWR